MALLIPLIWILALIMLSQVVCLFVERLFVLQRIESDHEGDENVQDVFEKALR
ncbi:hypothetical protein [Desulfolucanica intricata]|uniref:hypothetical protein n=1 Tax=Desulfolucanica intricata TaxID=1285191 RepID=UPI000A569E48|nr:hypothetical protein [Desulfolucanica intricata]